MVLITKQTKVMVQGITGKHGSFHTKLMKEYGTNIVCGVTPGKGNQKIEDVLVYDNVKEALEKHKVEWSIIFVPDMYVKDAAIEALDNGLNIVIITEGMPVHDVMQVVKKAKEKELKIIGPNCPGLIVPEEVKLGIMPGHIFKKGNIGIVSRSGTLTYEIVASLTKEGIGQSTVIGVGGDMLNGLDFIDILKLFQEDNETEKIVLVGEIGGDAEERAAEFIKKNVTKKVVAYIAGRTAPPEKRMGHAGAIVSGNTGTAQSKIDALKKNGIEVADLPSHIRGLLK